MINSLNDLQAAEVAYIVELLSMLKPIEDVQKKYEEFSGNRVSGTVVQEIRRVHGKRIKTQSEIYLRNVEGSPFWHDRVLLDKLYEIANDAMEATTHIRAGEDLREVDDPDRTNAINAIKAAHAIRKDREDLILKKNKNPDNAGKEEVQETDEGWEINTGLRIV